MPSTVPLIKASTQLQGVTDLTLIATIKPGLIEGIFDSKSYVWRLEKVLGLLDAARRGSRESDRVPNPFIDPVGRLRDVHFFRFAIDHQARKLVLNVTFDGGWEPYMRLIWGPLGTMLDLIFCHCEGYPLAATCDYSDYIAWVRAHEVPSQFFYADSPGTVADRAYLEQVERELRVAGDQPQADVRSLRNALTALNALPATPATPTSVAAAIRALKGLFSIASYFGAVPVAGFSAASWAVPVAADGHVLLRFAQDYLPDLRAWVAAGLFDPGQRFDHLRAQFDLERRWLMVSRWSRPARQDPAGLNLAEVQAGILSGWRVPAQRAVRGALVLVAIRPGTQAAAAARQWLAEAASAGVFATEAAPAIGEDLVACTMAVTFPGLKALELRAELLSTLPVEFQQGMEERAGILGDLRSNHPRHWQRPLMRAPLAGASALPLELSLVHLVFQLRCLEAPGDTLRTLPSGPLQAWIARHLQPLPFLDVLAIEPGWSEAAQAGEPAARNLFGYVDGISQPVPGGPSTGTGLWDDAVKRGEALLGWTNDRGDGPRPGVAQPLSWADNATFLVVRKIEMHVERFNAVVAAAASQLRAAGRYPAPGAAERVVRAKLMGRSDDGQPLVQPRGPGLNDFNYQLDPDGAQCPMASHVRRSNPRAALPGERVPRLLRRGMSYGPSPAAGPDASASSRGLLFMAYNASIAEQFEVIQRWIAGGNSSGVSSAHVDPILGVPRPGEPRIFRFEDQGQVVRVPLGDLPLCTLAWGLYAFVPPLSLLRALGQGHLSEPAASPAARSPVATPAPLSAKELFEDELLRRDAWTAVRKGPPATREPPADACPGVRRMGTTVLVGSHAGVRRVLGDDGSIFSAGGYGERMAATLGPSPFGQDDAGAHAGHGRPVVAALKRAIAESVSEPDAYVTAQKWVAQHLKDRLKAGADAGQAAISVDLVALGVDLLAELCRQWFGVPDGVDVQPGGPSPGAQPVRCPGHLLSTARAVFSAQPNAVVEALSKAQGQALKEALAKAFPRAIDGTADIPVLRKIHEALGLAHSGSGLNAEEAAGSAANALLGLPATFLGTWAKVLIAWTRGPDRALWVLQHALFVRRSSSGRPTHGDAVMVLRDVLIDTMAADPVADGIWRTVSLQQAPKGPLGIGLQLEDQVWLGLGSALVDLKEGLLKAHPHDPVHARSAFLRQAESLLFGGVALPGDGLPEAPHACPGHAMAVGALLGGLAALLSAGVWSTTASPTTLSLQALPTAA